MNSADGSFPAEPEGVGDEDQRLLVALHHAAPSGVFECDHCADGEALRGGESCAYCGDITPEEDE